MQEDVRAAMAVRLLRLADEPSLALDPGVLADARRLAATLGDDDLPGWFLLGTVYWYRCCGAARPGRARMLPTRSRYRCGL